MAAAGKYTAEQIQVLEGLEPVRKRPGMYIGSTDVRGLHHLVWEIVDNAIDEAMAGHCDHITVMLQADGGVSVEDNGRGIPVDLHPTTKRPALEVVLTTLHAGGKFGGDDSGYKVSGGLHGVGSSVVNALSKKLRAEVFLDGKIYMQEYARGKPVADMKTMGKATKHGTKITFYPDDTIFDTMEFSIDAILTRLRQQAYLTRRLRSRCSTSARSGRRRTHCSRASTGSTLKEVSPRTSPISTNPRSVSESLSTSRKSSRRDLWKSLCSTRRRSRNTWQASPIISTP